MPNSFEIVPVPPFRLVLTAWALKRRPENRIDRWEEEEEVDRPARRVRKSADRARGSMDRVRGSMVGVRGSADLVHRSTDGVYRRALALPRRAVAVAVRQVGSTEQPRLVVNVGGRALTSSDTAVVRSTIERLLGVRIDLAPFYAIAAGKPPLESLVRSLRGLKPPRFPSIHEGLLNAIACQQVSLASGLTILSRLVDRYGPVPPGEDLHAFPRPVDLAGAREADLRKIGFSGTKSRAILELSEGVASGRVDLESLASLPNDHIVERLRELRGIGRWSAEYCLLRGFGRLDTFPGDDVGALNNLQRALRARAPLTYETARRRLAPWKPYAGLLYFHLLIGRLAAREMVAV